MSAYVPMDQILRCMIGTGHGLKFKAYRDVIENIVSSFSRDSALLETARQCFRSDLQLSRTRLVKACSGARVVDKDGLCSVCEGVISGSVRAFSDCRHMAHSACLGRCHRCIILL
jgi:hypothetical protein